MKLLVFATVLLSAQFSFGAEKTLNLKVEMPDGAKMVQISPVTTDESVNAAKIELINYVRNHGQKSCLEFTKKAKDILETNKEILNAEISYSHSSGIPAVYSVDVVLNEKKKCQFQVLDRNGGVVKPLTSSDEKAFIKTVVDSIKEAKDREELAAKKQGLKDGVNLEDEELMKSLGVQTRNNPQNLK